LPRRNDRCAVFIHGDSAEICLRPQITKVVASHRRWRRKLLTGQRQSSTGKLHWSRLVDKSAPGYHKRILRKQPREFLRIVSEKDASTASLCDVAKQLGIAVGRLAETDHANRDPCLLAFLDQLLILARFLGICGICKQDDMSRARL